MTMDTDEIEQAVEQRRVWLQGQLDTAATRFGIELAGEAVNTFDMRSAGAPAREGGRAVWLRVVVEDPDYQPACRWDGNVEANSIRGVPKPEVLRWADWHHTDSYLAGRRLRGEVMTLAPGSTIAPGGVLLGDPHLPQSWWTDLGAALAALAAHPVTMDHELGAVRYTINGVRQHFGVMLTETPSLIWTGQQRMRICTGEICAGRRCAFWTGRVGDQHLRDTTRQPCTATACCTTPPPSGSVPCRSWKRAAARSRSSSRSAATSGSSARAAIWTRPRNTFVPQAPTSSPA